MPIMNPSQYDCDNMEIGDVVFIKPRSFLYRFIRNHFYKDKLKIKVRDGWNEPTKYKIYYQEDCTLMYAWDIACMKQYENCVPVIYSNRLNSTIKNLSSEKCLSQTEVEKIKSILESVEITEKMARKEHVKNIKQNIVEKQLKMENLICPRCNGELKLRNGRNGKFYGCSNYPRCRFTMPY